MVHPVAHYNVTGKLPAAQGDASAPGRRAWVRSVAQWKDRLSQTGNPLPPLGKQADACGTNAVGTVSQAPVGASTWTRLQRLQTELVWVAVGNLLAFLGSLAGVKVLTFLLGPEEYGRLALGLTIVGLTVLVLYGASGQVVWRFFALYRERRNLGLYFFLLKRAYGVIAVLVVGLAALSGLGARFWAGADWAWLVTGAFLFGMFSGTGNGLASFQSAVRARKTVAFHQAADPWLRLALAVVALHWLGARSHVALLGYLLGAMLVTASQAVFVWKREDVRVNWSTPDPDHQQLRASFGELWAFAGPVAIWSVMAAVSAYSDRWVLQGLFGPREVGIYFGLYQIANAPISLLSAVLGQLLVPVIFERAGTLTTAVQEEDASRLFRWSVLLMGLTTLLFTIAMGFFSRFLVMLVTTGEFVHGHAVLWVIALGLSIFNVAQMISVKGFYYNQTGIYLVPKSLHGVLSLVFGFFLARQFGIQGVAWALCLSSLVYLLAVLAANRKLGSIGPEASRWDRRGAWSPGF